ncbi:MAG: response regulator [Proteobacteria bacterium]|nr:response regulator [Pseudomonadota bacterium]
MTDKFDHTILIVDDEEQVAKSLGRLMKQMGVKYVYMASGQAGIDRIKSASTPFSLIISDQRMPEMEGSEFLAIAKKITPNTIRFLLTGYADVDAVTRAVNKGAIHRYITKPWNNNSLIETVKAGLEQYELVMENDRLFKLAKAQNAKLFTLNTDLKKSSVVHQRAIVQRDKEIEQLKKRLETGFQNRNYINEIEILLRENDLLGTDKLNTLHAAIIAELFEQFQDIATRNGFEMPDNIPGG